MKENLKKYGLYAVLVSIIVLLIIPVLEKKEQLSNAMSIAGIIVSILSLFLSILFYYLADESSKKAIDSLNEIKQLHSEIKTFTDRVFDQTFQLLKDNVNSQMTLNEYNVTGAVRNQETDFLFYIYGICKEGNCITCEELYIKFDNNKKLVDNMLSKAIHNKIIEIDSDKKIRLCAGNSNSSNLGSSN